jgi:hypothetical protein
MTPPPPVVFHHPFSMLMAGPSKSGKSFFTVNLLQHMHYIKPTPTRIMWCYGEKNEQQFKNIALACGSINIEFIEGIPCIQDITPDERNLIIVDDLMDDAGKSKIISNLFTKGSHHRNLSVILIVQNLFHHGPRMRDISLNANYIVLFKNPRDSRQIVSLNLQIYPNDKGYLTSAYRQATSRPHGYLIIILTQRALDTERLVTGIFPPEFPFMFIPE